MHLRSLALKLSFLVGLFALTVSPARAFITITSQPQSQTVAAGGTAQFVVLASSNLGAVTYQWYFSLPGSSTATAIVGATLNTLTLPNVTVAGNSGFRYQVRITDAAAFLDSNAATLTVSTATAVPVITTQPVSQTVAVGGSATFSVVATGTGPLSYQWYATDSTGSISTALGTGSSYTLLAATAANNGLRFNVVVTNSAGQAISAYATLTVSAATTAPVITSQPISRSTTVGESTSFTVIATGAAPLSYQWRVGGTNLAGATSSTWTYTPAAGDVGVYSINVVVSNAAGSVTSNSATVTVTAAPTTPTAPVITSQPISRTVNVGESVSFSVIATGTAPLTYQWFINGAPLTGFTTATLSLANIAASLSGGSYTVRVTNSAGSVTSNAAILSVAGVPTTPPTTTPPTTTPPTTTPPTTTPPTGSASNPGRLINLSVRTQISTPGDNFTLGYVVGGNGTSGAKPLVIRAAGPSLGAFGVPGTLGDPKLESFAGSTKTGENDNWGGSSQLTAALAAVGAFSYTGPGSLDSAVSTSISTRDNSVVVSGVGNSTGEVIAEVYDATPLNAFTTGTPRLLNVSVRKHLGTGLTAGFVLGGSGSTKVLIRAVGPGLAAFGVPGTVADPQLTLFQSSTKIGENDNWSGTAALTAAFSSVGAFALPGANSLDAALLVTLQPGQYSVQVSGVSNTTGVAVVEIYEIP